MIQIQIWADFECPYSYFQTIVLEKLQTKYQDRLEIVWRAFELTPVEGNISPPQSYIDNLEAAKSESIVMQENLKLLTPKFLTYTWLAQESVYFANSQGLSLKLARALFDAFFLSGFDISSEEIVMKIASQAGVDTQQLWQALDNGELTKYVMADEQEFKTYGFQGLPAMLIGEKNFSPRSFMPMTGYKTLEELLEILPN
ncbi:thioredoxin domain-containing protein [Polynucleobacter paneuropaeus]|uniref:Thioredoxin domain-containing protein n=1 Tax=Polynucleobacter paneuropaeus TaxID=2527775 RepID=A0AAE2YKA8_9BURK|nr:thioredoxin domain-containing protein [Polynucleobacter paneuropaeus]MBT8591139.1 thioredoxin domain-containing protein [Polynucleobacter paneuropaeus]MBT8596529.1 thioredoxin domain-containing protein [Polynucleobacter paneuropaeus]MBT8598342.1 thioredoxin domain-containing protein [Polynucleobacter paneuropaeus]